MFKVLSAAGLALVVMGCSASGEDRRTVVASVYPLAWAAQRLAGDDWQVIDLTPTGAEAHDVELSLEDRAAIQRADIIVYLGDIGFQPQVETAVDDASGVVVRPDVLQPAVQGADPHFWLAPDLMANAGLDVLSAFSEVAPPPDGRAQRFFEALDALASRYRTGLRRCRFSTLVVNHEAFGYLADIYGLRQFGLAGLIPEAEPSAERLAEAERLIDAGEAGAVFYEEHEDARRIAETVAADARVPALPLSTLESQPAEGDYLSVMEDNLESLREGLGCR